MSEKQTDIGRSDVAVIGGGPAGLMAAERLSAAGFTVTIFEGMATPGRKFLMAGRGGLNLTHGEPLDRFVARYGRQADRFETFLARFSPDDLRHWAEGLGSETFVGSSGRVFPREMKASRLLRAWLARLSAQNAVLRPRHRWQGWDGDHLLFRDAEDRPVRHLAKATILALGGASWPTLGSDAAWVPWLAERGVAVTPFQPSNCGVEIDWSAHLRDRIAGQPLKNIALQLGQHRVRGELMITGYGIEGGPVYALSAAIREYLTANGSARLHLDLKPDLPVTALAQRLAARRHGQSLSQYLKKDLHLPAAAYVLLREAAGVIPAEPGNLAALLKAVPLAVQRARPIERAISSAGGVDFAAVTVDLMLRALPGTFVCGEMLDWEAPTGGYLLQGCFATAVVAADGVRQYLRDGRSQSAMV
jgi:uncharacterized flavoprotein (TIGR03862 family)